MIKKELEKRAKVKEEKIKTIRLTANTLVIPKQ